MNRNDGCPRNVKIEDGDFDEFDKSSSSYDEEKNKRRMGVHHPKFLLLFTEDDKLFVTIGTSNFNFAGTIEGSYVCMFDLAKNEVKEEPDGIVTNFGLILADFIQWEQVSRRSKSFVCLI